MREYFQKIFGYSLSCYLFVFVCLPIYLEWMIFPMGPFTKIYNPRKMCNLSNSWKNPLENWQIFLIHRVKSMQKFLHASKAFCLFSLKNNWTSRQIKQESYKTERVRYGIDARWVLVFGVSRVSTSPLVYSLKRPINYCCNICTIFCMIFKKRLFIEALCRPLFMKYACCKPLFPFQNNASWIMPAILISI